ncbi:hypothetical protein BX600DRAFT_284029 [Xylariales sp. PMI_506]|nr:hypothetical protein BX600DRAFT_284029 [Xylariales sp. PMI_506]
MSYHGSEYRPPLPPRSPRPPVAGAGSSSSSPATAGPAATQGYSYFPPPPGSAASEVVPPQLPPRPQGFEGSPAGPNSYQHAHGLAPPSGPGGAGYMSFPPPPVSPNRAQPQPPAASGLKPPLPPRPRPGSSGSSASSSHVSTPAATASSSAFPSPAYHNPNQLTSFPPPPPGPPPGPPPARTSSSSSSLYYSPPSGSPAPPESAASSSAPLPPPALETPGGPRSKFPTFPGPSVDPEIPDSPPPPYTPVAESSTRRPSPPASTPPTAAAPQTPVAASSRPSSPPTGSSVSNPQSPHELSFFPPPPLVSAMPEHDPIDELLQEMEIGSASGVRSEEHQGNVSAPSAITSPSTAPSGNDTPPPLRSNGVTSPPPRPPKTLVAGAGGSEPTGTLVSQSQQPDVGLVNGASPTAPESQLRPSPIQATSNPSSGRQPDVVNRPSIKTYQAYNPSVAPDPERRNGTPRVRFNIDLPTSSTPSSPPPLRPWGELPGSPPFSRTPSPASPGRPPCLSTPTTEATTWYAYPDVPNFLICTHCYSAYIAPTEFRDTFKPFADTSGSPLPRFCKFSRPRMRDYLFPRAVQSGDLEPVVRWMNVDVLS